MLPNRSPIHQIFSVPTVSKTQHNRINNKCHLLPLLAEGVDEVGEEGEEAEEVVEVEGVVPTIGELTTIETVQIARMAS